MFKAINCIILLALCACSNLETAPYNERAVEQVVKTSQELNLFYSELSQKNSVDRLYRNYQSKYLQISSELYTLKLLNGAREHNHEFLKISEILIEEWEKYEIRHKQKNNYPDGLIKIHRKRLNSILMSMLSAETKRKEL